MNAEESASEAWAELIQHYQSSGFKERRRLTIYFCTTKMELGEHPRRFLLCVDQMVKELERVDRPVDPKDIDIVILSGRTPQYDAEVRILESSSDWPTSHSTLRGGGDVTNLSPFWEGTAQKYPLPGTCLTNPLVK